MSEDGKTIAVDDQPLHHIGEFLRRHGELAGAARMRANSRIMHAPHRDAEMVAQSLTQALGVRLLRRIVIDMGMVAGDGGHDSIVLVFFATNHWTVLEHIPPKLKTLAIRICSNILIWRESFSARCFHLAGKHANAKK